MRDDETQKIQKIFYLLLCMFATAFLYNQASAQEDAKNQPVHTLEQIVVTGTKTPHNLKDTPVETVVIDQKDITKTNAQNVMDVLKNIPGISASVHDDTFGTYTWRAKMRGLNFNDGYALILIDGQRVMGPGQSGGMGEYGIGLNQLPIEMIEKIEIVKGPGSALYGSDAMAGVINIITRKTPKKQAGGAGVSYGWYKIKERIKNGVTEEASEDSRNHSQAYAYYGNRISEKAGYLFQYNYENAQDIGNTRIDSARHSFMGKADADLTEQISLFSKFEISDYEKEDSREEESWRLAAGMDWQPNEDHILLFKGYTYNWDFNHGFVDKSHGHKYGDIGYHQIEGQYTWYFNENHAFTGGMEFQQQNIEFTIDNEGGSQVSVNENVDIFSLYLQDEIALFDQKMTLVPGIRYDDHSTFGEEVNPKISAMYQLFESTTLRASVGRSFKSPTIRQLYYDAPYKHGNYYNQSNPDLQPETAIGYSAGIEQWLVKNSLMFSVSYFRNDVDDLVIVEDTGKFYNELPLKIYRNVEEAMIQGIEIMSRAWVGENFSLALSYTFTDSENKENNKDLTYIPDHQFSITPAFDLDDYGAGISATLSYYSKQYTNTDNSSEIDDYAMVDAKIYKQLGKAAKLSFEADNIFDSDKGDDKNFRTGRTFTLKMDLTF